MQDYKDPNKNLFSGNKISNETSSYNPVRPENTTAIDIYNTIKNDYSIHQRSEIIHDIIKIHIKHLDNELELATLNLENTHKAKDYFWEFFDSKPLNIKPLS